MEKHINSYNYAIFRFYQNFYRPELRSRMKLLHLQQTLPNTDQRVVNARRNHNLYKRLYKRKRNEIAQRFQTHPQLVVLKLQMISTPAMRTLTPPRSPPKKRKRNNNK